MTNANGGYTSSTAMVPASPAQSGLARREDFSGIEQRTQSETAIYAAAAAVRAEVESRYVYAERHPRSLDDVRVKLNAACSRPGFAASAKYAKPMGGTTVKGPSVRFAEEVARVLGNVLISSRIVTDDDEKRTISVTVTDLESNLTIPAEVVVSKVVERRSPREGQEIVGKRQNSTGQVTYLVRASDDEVAVKQASAVSKARRNAVLQLLPSDLLEEAMATVDKTLRGEAQADPAAARKRVVDAFASHGVMPSDLVQYLGHPLEQITPLEMEELRTAYAGILDGEVKWADLVAAKAPSAAQEAPATGLKAKLIKAKAAAAAVVHDGEVISEDGEILNIKATRDAKGEP